MTDVGPPLERLVRRLLDTPPDFLDEPRVDTRGRVVVGAVVNDVLRLHGACASTADLAAFRGSSAKADRNRLSLAAVAAWLLADEWFLGRGLALPALLAVLDGMAGELAAGAPAERFVSDPDRREELARLALARLGYRPEGETEQQATDRLSAISGAERRRLLEASRAAEARAREIRIALAKKAAEESADKWTRE
jgi:hypothetical protein